MKVKRGAKRAANEVVLAGDIGGTNARFSLCDVTGRRVVHKAALPSREHRTFESALGRFLDDAAAALGGAPQVLAASFGIAGPVVDQRVKTTNLPWMVDARKVARRLGLVKVTLLNDLVAVGLGALEATPKELVVLHRGRPKGRGATVAAIAAGTGLGEALFVWDGAVHVPCSTEGGHVDFAARDELEAELFAELAAELGHVSVERVASGSSISRLYRFFVETKRVREAKANRAIIDEARDANVAIVELAESGRSEAAMRTLDLWASLYGAEAGNLALKSLATGGVYVCGGVSTRLAPILARGLPARRRGRKPSPFVEAFLAKGRMRRVLEEIPVAVAAVPGAGLRGAAAHAARAAAGVAEPRPV